MKCVIAFACLLAAASAGFINSGVAYTSGYGYGSPLAYSTNYVAPVAYSPRSYGYQSSSVHPVGYTYAGYGYTAPVVGLASEARQVDPVAIAAGAPLPTGDTVEVAAAKAAHFQAHAVAKNEHFVAKAATPITTYTAGVAPITTYSAGVAPITTYSAGVAPITYSAGVAPITTYSAYSTPLVSEARQVDPVAIAAGAPLPTGDTVEVAAAKAVHYQAHAAAKSGSVYAKSFAPITGYTGQVYAKAFAPVTAYTHGVAPLTTYTHGVSPLTTYTHGVSPLTTYTNGLTYSAYSTPIASEARLVDPVAIAAGAPLPTGDTYEVAAAKAVHFQAHHEAKKGHLLAKTGHFIAKRSPLFAPLAYSAPAAYGYSAYAGPHAYNTAYTGYTGYGYGRYPGAYYG